MNTFYLCFIDIWSQAPGPVGRKASISCKKLPVNLIQCYDSSIVNNISLHWLLIRIWHKATVSNCQGVSYSEAQSGRWGLFQTKKCILNLLKISHIEFLLLVMLYFLRPFPSLMNLVLPLCWKEVWTSVLCWCCGGPY